MIVDTSKYIKKCPKCDVDIKPIRTASTSTKALAGVMGGAGALVGFGLGGPIGAVIGGTVGYVANKANLMDMEDSHDHTQCYEYKCPKCGLSWKENIETNDDPDDPSWMMMAGN